MSSIPVARPAARGPAAPAAVGHAHAPAPAPAVPPRVLRLPTLDGTAPMDAAEAFRDLPGLALLESARPGRTGRWSFLTADPIAVLDAAAEGPDPFVEARALLGRLGSGSPGIGPSESLPAGSVREASSEPPPFAGGLVGYLAYDLGRRFERLPAVARVDQHLPMLRLALHDWVIAWNRRTGAAWLGVCTVDGDTGRADRRMRDVLARLDGSAAGTHRARGARDADARDAVHGGVHGGAPGGVQGAGAPTSLVTGTSHAEWLAGVEAVREAIGRGEIYQANLTRRLEAPFSGDPWPLFRRLRTGDPALFAGYLDLGPSPATGARRALLSASPEPFLAVDSGGRVATDPIKGTRPRGRTHEEDRALARELLASGKDQAENVMIVDVLRNDLGRVCIPGTVRVPRLLRLERTATVQHLVTTVTGQLRPDADAFDLLAASFPGGSITGAPKIRAMEVVENLEPVRRGPYCGAMLWLGPDGRLGSSILIRTFVADGERLTLHVGGGITWRSDPQEEWDETVAKARGPLSSIGALEVPS